MTEQRVGRLAPVEGALAWIEQRAGLTPSGLAVTASAALAWIAGWWLGSRVAFLMAYGAMAMLLGVLLLGRRRVAIEAARSDLPARVREDQTVTVELSLRTRRRVSGVVLEEAQHPLIGGPIRLLVATLRPGEEAAHAYAFTPGLRGVYPIGPLVAIRSDPFGLTRRRVRLLPEAEIIVHPATEAVRDRVLSREWEDPPVRPPVSKPWPTGFEFYGMRDYVRGDDPRRIVWRAVARTGRYLVRESEQGITDRVTIVLDDDARRHVAGEPSETFEAAVRAAASLGAHHLRDGFAVTVEVNERRIAAGLRGGSARIALLDRLARARLTREPLTTAVRRLLGDPRRDTHVIILTPFLEHDAAAMLRVLLDRGGSMTLVHIVGEDPEPASLQRAAALGCEIVELRAGAPLARVFGRAIGAGIRR